MRTIDADALYETLCHILDRQDSEEFEQAVFESIANAPTVEVPHWISCSDRLPEENEVVLTQARFADDVKMAVSARIDYNYWTGWGTREVNVVAWMPLPPVYQEEDNK